MSPEASVASAGALRGSVLRITLAASADGGKRARRAAGTVSRVLLAAASDVAEGGSRMSEIDMTAIPGGPCPALGATDP